MNAERKKAAEELRTTLSQLDPDRIYEIFGVDQRAPTLWEQQTTDLAYGATLAEASIADCAYVRIEPQHGVLLQTTKNKRQGRIVEVLQPVSESGEPRLFADHIVEQTRELIRENRRRKTITRR